jgi:peptidyl-prolyl isomerase G (cyclophilin G)
LKKATMNESDKIPEHVFLQVSIAGAPPQTIVIQLFHKQVPKTCDNFVALVSCKETTTRRKQQQQHPHPPTYRGCEFHRIIDKFMVQGGDFERFDGTGGYSPLYSGGTFDDESFCISHNQAGIVSMANAGANTNKSQFFITLQATPHLDKKHVAFGKVVVGIDTVQRMTSVELEDNGRPVSMQRIVIIDCGVGFGNSNDKDDDDDDSVQEKERVKKKKKKMSSKKNSKKNSERRHGSSSRSTDDDDDDEERGRKKQHKKQSRDYTSSSSSDDEDSRDDRRRRHKKHKKRDRHHRRHYDDSSSDDDATDDDDRRKKRKHRSKSSSKHRKREN